MKRFHKRFGFWLVILGALIAAFVFFKGFSKGIPVKTTMAERKDIEITVGATALGTVKARDEVRITARRAGRVSRLSIEEGDLVKKGRVLAEFDPEEALVNLNAAKSAYERAKSVFEELKLAYEPAEIEVESSIAEAQARLKETEKRAERFRDLSKRGLLSSQELESVEREWDVLRAAYNRALSGRKRLRADAEKITAQGAAVREAKSALDLARLNYEYSFIKAPISGAVARRPVELGDTVPKGGLIAALVDMGSLYIEATIDEADVGHVRSGQPARAAMDAYPGRSFEGSVYMLSPVVTGSEREARTFIVRVKLSDAFTSGSGNPEGPVLKPGMSADVEIVVDTLRNSLALPIQAVFERPDGDYIYVLERGRARLRRVVVGRSSFDHVEIATGLREGEEAILTPEAAGLRDGARIKPLGE